MAVLTLRYLDRMRTIVCAVAALLLLAGCGGASKADSGPTSPADATASYLEVVHAVSPGGGDTTNPYTAQVDKAALKMAHAICDGLDAHPNSETYQAAIDGASSGGDTATGKPYVDAAIGAFCPQHLNLKG